MIELDAETQSQILNLYIAGQLDLSAIADICCISFDALVAFLDDPQTTARLDTIQRLASRRARLIAAEARVLALTRLQAIAAHQPDPGHTPPKLFTRQLETTRKAAAQLLRLTPPPRITPPPGGTGFQPVRIPSECRGHGSARPRSRDPLRREPHPSSAAPVPVPPPTVSGASGFPSGAEARGGVPESTASDNLHELRARRFPLEAPPAQDIPAPSPTRAWTIDQLRQPPTASPDPP